MPVEFDDYADDQETDVPVRAGSNGHRILEFLASHPEMGFTPSEIHDRVDIPKGSVGPTLQRLAERDLVRHKGSYWAIARDDRLTALDATMHSLDAIQSLEDDAGAIDWERAAATEDELDAWRASQREEDDS